MMMEAEERHQEPAHREQDDEELTDEQVQQILKEAEERLRQRAANHVDKDSALKGLKIPKLRNEAIETPYLQEKGGIAEANAALLVPKEQRELANQARTVEKPQQSKKSSEKVSSGPEWFNLPKTLMTPQLKRDLQLIEMRSVLDPHRHYKKDIRQGKVPTFSQTGTVIEGPTEWYSSRLNRKDRAKNFVEETMAVEKETGRFKRKYADIQESKTSGKKGHYKTLMAKRKKKS